MNGITVALAAGALSFPEGGGHVWAYLNWALGLQSLGCEVLWLEHVYDPVLDETWRERVTLLRHHLTPFGLADALIPYRLVDGEIAYLNGGSETDAQQPPADVDLLLSLYYGLTNRCIRQFRRSALVDIDPGLLQAWVSSGEIALGHYDRYFSIGENVGASSARCHDGGVCWQYIPPPVSLNAWPALPPARTGRYTTISNWYAREWLAYGKYSFSNDKRVSFLEYRDLPAHTPAPLELALALGPGDADECRMLEERGWHVREAKDIGGTPDAYRTYIQQSRGEFSCAKPSYVHFQNAWISDRTLCYLASGKPAVVQYTGPSSLLPRDEGLLRFASFDEAVSALDAVEGEYERHCRAARDLAERYFDARKVVGGVLERALA